MKKSIALLVCGLLMFSLIAMAGGQPHPAETPDTKNAPHYSEPKEVDTQPKPLQEININYPPKHEGQIPSAYVILEIRVEEDGQASDLKVIEISPPGAEAFAQEALAAFRGVRFSPARRQGLQVKSLFRVKVTFGLDGEEQ